MESIHIAKEVILNLFNDGKIDVAKYGKEPRKSWKIRFRILLAWNGHKKADSINCAITVIAPKYLHRKLHIWIGNFKKKGKTAIFIAFDGPFPPLIFFQNLKNVEFSEFSWHLFSRQQQCKNRSRMFFLTEICSSLSFSWSYSKWDMGKIPKFSVQNHSSEIFRQNHVPIIILCQHWWFHTNSLDAVSTTSQKPLTQKLDFLNSRKWVQVGFSWLLWEKLLMRIFFVALGALITSVPSPHQLCSWRGNLL